MTRKTAQDSAMTNGNSNERRSEERPIAVEESLAILRQRVRERIGPVVTHLPATDVALLVEDIVRLKFKYEGPAALRATPPFSHDATSDARPE
jgi:hypothetical protein